MNSILKTLTKSELQDIISGGISSEIAKHEANRKKAVRVTAVKTAIGDAKNRVLSIRVRNPFYGKK